MISANIVFARKVGDKAIVKTSSDEWFELDLCAFESLQNLIGKAVSQMAFSEKDLKNLSEFETAGLLENSKENLRTEFPILSNQQISDKIYSWLMVAIFPILAASYVFFVFRFRLFVEYQHLFLLDVVSIIALISSYFLLCLIHELGHWISAFVYTRQRGKIGFSWSNLGPVFYCQIPPQFVFSRFERIVVNATGIIFQIVFLIAIWIVLGEEKVAQILISIVVWQCAANLLPIKGTDGYWLAEDICGQHLQTATKLIFYLIFLSLLGIVWINVVLIVFHKNIIILSNMVDWTEPSVVIGGAFILFQYVFLAWKLIRKFA